MNLDPDLIGIFGGLFFLLVGGANLFLTHRLQRAFKQSADHRVGIRAAIDRANGDTGLIATWFRRLLGAVLFGAGAWLLYMSFTDRLNG